MPSITAPVIIGGLGAAASVGGALLTSSAASDASQTQANAATQASNNTTQIAQQNAARLQPYATGGLGPMAEAKTLASAGTNLTIPQATTTTPPAYNYLPVNTLTPEKTNLQSLSSWEPTQAKLESTPGYQFALSQGLKSTQNSYAAQGLGQSGAALHGAADYATGLASNTYQQQYANYLSGNQQVLNQNTQTMANNENAFNQKATAGNQAINNNSANFNENLSANNLNYNQLLNSNTQKLAQNNQQYNQLYNVAALGENAAAQTGAQANQSSQQANNYLTGAAAANAAGTVGVANSLAGGLSGVVNAGQNYLLQQAFAPGGMYNPQTVR